MEMTEELEKLTATLEKYRKNKTLVPPEDLAGKYRVPFSKLKKQLADELSLYLKSTITEGMVFVQDEHFETFVQAVNCIIAEMQIGKRAGRAAFREFDLGQVKQLAEELRIRVYKEAWMPYFQNYLCLYTTEACFSEENPQTPRIYNSLVDKFWNPEKEEWTKNETPDEPAVLIYMQKTNRTEVTL